MGRVEFGRKGRYVDEWIFFLYHWGPSSEISTEWVSLSYRRIEKDTIHHLFVYLFRKFHKFRLYPHPASSLRSDLSELQLT